MRALYKHSGRNAESWQPVVVQDCKGARPGGCEFVLRDLEAGTDFAFWMPRLFTILPLA